MIVNGCTVQTVTNNGINLHSGNASVSNSVISGCATGIAVKTATAHLSESMITNNGTALMGPGKITSSGK